MIVQVRSPNAEGVKYATSDEAASYASLLASVVALLGPPASIDNVRIVFKGNVLVRDVPVDKQGVYENDTIVALVDRPLPSPPASPELVVPPGMTDAPKPLPPSPSRGGFFDLLSRTGPAPQGPAPSRAAPVQITFDPALVTQLTDMGFSENRAKRALAVNRMNVERAMNWLIDHIDDPTLDEPLPPQVMSAPSAPRPATPDPALIKRLEEMGFTDAQAREALVATHNNYEAACNYLLGDPDSVPIQGLLPPGMMEQAMQMASNNPLVRAALADPRLQEVFQTLLMDPSQINRFLEDPTIGPLMLSIAHSMFRPTNH
ncbi:nucleus accumbens-associated protein 2 [Pelomyxa schiedti]|nr:nucleus accumbens-associated protein 2 [Pelomyxa schiedti]